MKLKKLKTLNGFERTNQLQASRSGDVLVGGGDVACKVWDGRTGKVLAKFNKLDDEDGVGVYNDLSPDGTLLAVGHWHMTTGVFDLRTGKRVARLSKLKKDTPTSAHPVAFSPDGKLLACVNWGKLEVFRVKDWQPAWPAVQHRPQIAGIAWTPDSKQVASSGGKSIIFWNAVDGKKTLELTGHKKMVHGPAIAADGSFVATPGEDGVVKLWKLPSGKPFGEYADHKTLIFRVILAADGRTAASYGYNDEHHLWDTATQRQIGKQSSSSDSAIAFSPDGQWLVIPGFDVTRNRRRSEPLRLIDTRTGKVAATLDPTFERIAFVGENRLATAQPGKVVLWEIVK